MNMGRSVATGGKKVKAGAREATRSPQPQAPSPLLLLEWYDRYRRILPWRAMKGEMPDPYRVWLSEIMLQQTTVGAVGPYFRRFVNRWPTVAHLARARRGEILKMWAGLGYYRRAHLLHDCAKKIMCDYGGEFPRDEESLRALPGFGPYTAAALAAIAFDKRASAVDGNAERVMARLHAVRVPLPQAKPRLRMLAESMLPDARFGDYAQALMDLGATICTPRHPKCDLCPWMKDCCAHALGIAGNLPRRLKAKAKPVRRAIAFVALNGKGEVLLRRRPKDGLLGGMMEVPSSAWREDPMPTLAKAAKEAPGKARWRLVPGHVRHVFSHFELEMAVAAGHLAGADCGVWRPAKKLGGEALPSVMRKILRHAAAAGIIKLPFP